MEHTPVNTGTQSISMSHILRTACLLLVLCIGSVWSSGMDDLFPRAPYRILPLSPWKTEAVSLAHGTPDICITDNGSLVALERSVSRLSIFPPGRGEPTVLEPKARGQEFPGGLRHFKGCREITAASAEHCLGATAVATDGKIVYVLYILDVPTEALAKSDVRYLERNRVRRMLRFDLTGKPLGGWEHYLRWTEESGGRDDPEVMALDSQGRIYVAGYTGVITSYAPDGTVYRRWKVLTPEMEKTWLKPDGPMIDEVRMRMIYSPQDYRKIEADERETRRRMSADLEEQVRGGDPGFIRVKAEETPAVVSGLAVDEDGNMYITGNGLRGLLKIPPSGESELIHLWRLDKTRGPISTALRDVAYRNGRLVTASDGVCVFVFQKDGTLLGYLVSQRPYGSEFHTQVAFDEKGNICVVGLRGPFEDSPWPDVFEPTEETKEE